ncbi:MAG: sugar phosphate isomerase/epimerase family protein, partial [Candidatus Poribacteria bacterium]
VQFGFSCAGLPDLPDDIDVRWCDKIRREIESRRITMSAISGTFNMIDPNVQKRQDGLRRLGILASACDRLGVSVITLCTGTRDPENMWRRHPENDSPEAWEDLIATMSEALKIAEGNGITLAFEPEVSNVVDSASKGRRLLDQMQSPYLKVIMDPANIFHKGELPHMREILDEAFDLLGEDIVIAHAKDLSRDGEAGHEAAGQGLLDYDQYLSLLNSVGFDVPLILHGLSEAQVDECVAFLRGKMTSINN